MTIIEVRIPLSDLQALSREDMEDLIEDRVEEENLDINRALGPPTNDGEFLIYRFPEPRPFFPR